MAGTIRHPCIRNIPYWDATFPGLALRVSQRGRKAWLVRYRVDGAQRRMMLGYFPDVSLLDARRQARIKLDEVGEMNPRLVRRSDILRTLNAAVDRGAPVQANRILEIVRKMFNWAASRDYVEHSPCFGVKKPTKELPRERNLSPEEVRLILRLVEEGYIDGEGRRVWMDKPLRIAIKLLLLTGQRPGEVAEALQAEFDLDEAVWTIPGSRTKNGRLHRVLLLPRAHALVKEAMALALGGVFLFPATSWTRAGKPGVKSIGDTAVCDALKRVLPGANIENVRPHDFRESVATGLASIGVDEVVISALLNHISGGVTRRHYNRYRYEKEKREALQAWQEELMPILGESSQKTGSVSARRR